MAFTITSFTGNYGLVSADRGNLRKATDTVAQTITLDTTLGAGWACNIENANTGITLANNSVVLKPSSGTVDGASTFTMYRGDVRGVSCDGTNWLSISIRLGDANFNGSVPTIKNLNSAQQVVPATMWSCVVGSDVTWAFPGANTLATFLSGSNATLTVQPNTRYRFKIVNMEVTTGPSSHTALLGFLGTAGFGDCKYQTLHHSGVAQSNASAQMKQNIVATGSAVVAATTSTIFIVSAEGHFGITSAGTIIPAMAMANDPTGTIIVKTGTMFECWAIGSNTVTATGAWT